MIYPSYLVVFLLQHLLWSAAGVWTLPPSYLQIEREAHGYSKVQEKGPVWELESPASSLTAAHLVVGGAVFRGRWRWGPTAWGVRFITAVTLTLQAQSGGGGRDTDDSSFTPSHNKPALADWSRRGWEGVEAQLNDRKP